MKPVWGFLGGMVVIAGCAASGENLPFRIGDRTYVVGPALDAAGQNTGLIVTGPDGTPLTQADGPDADRVIREFCRTQGRLNGTTGRFVVSGGAGFWRYGGCGA
ncbi:hypothetical protein [Paracoccus pacificus]|uniref:Uncharacterized protein n=1 Tax=Paracoccus pacificus TaxID=1463598 RepID=A0ABW4RDR2_9RHOB